MEPLKVFQFIEDTIYEFFLWLWLLPKTWVKVLREPAWARGYVPGEIEKKEGRYEEYMSPVMCLLASSVLPFLGIARLRGALDGSAPQAAVMLLIVGFLFGLVPAVWAAAEVVGDGKPIGRTSFRPVFGAQCLLFSPFYVALLLPVAVPGLVRGVSVRAMRIPMLAVWALALIWLLRAQWKVWRLGARTGRGFVLAGLSSLVVPAAAWVLAVRIWP